MPSDEFQPILNRSLAKVNVAPLIEAVCPLLRELVNYGSGVLARCARAPINQGKENEDIAPLMLYRHLLEWIDSVEVLLSEACADGSTAPLRAAFEASMSLEYILQDRAKYASRSLSWLYVDTLNRIATWEKYDTDTEAGMAFRASYQAQFSNLNPDLSSEKDGIKAAARGLRAVIDRPQFDDIRAEYARPQKNRIKFPNWFSLFGGPKNRRELAHSLNQSGEYALFYGPWSRSVHAEDSSLYWAQDAKVFAIASMRGPKRFKDNGEMAANYMIRGIRLMVEHFRGENVSPWYMREVRDRYMALSKLNVRFNEDEDSD